MGVIQPSLLFVESIFKGMKSIAGGKATSASSTVPTSTLSSTSTTVKPGIQRSAPGSAPRGTDNGIYIGISVGAVGGVGALALIIYYLRLVIFLE